MRIALTAALLVAAAALGPSTPARTAADCTRDSTGLVPLNELKANRYNGFQGGLYPNGSNSPPKRYLVEGAAVAKRVRGRIVLLAIGMSNATQEFRAFIELARRQRNLNPQLRLVDGAQGGQDAVRIGDASAPYWMRVDERLAAAGVTRGQVQAVWLKEAIARPTAGFPSETRRLHALLRRIVAILDRRFPRLRLVYVSSRTYAGYAATPLNPEPYAYESGFAAKWLVQDRIARRIKGPWIGWGPYLWADGSRARSDGLAWSCADFGADGTHPSAVGRMKVADRLLRFFATSSTSKRWFRRN